eukprot:CAMPEP_0185275314 /NCGR_PEP_ID=MMETSP1359-20130426/53811_1 /TAXON_ID=552665 /ORGANISM="Bigelowiella longifila, Strain CCMP242" /LENGTH=305 /DNA_ID=CAMNT_0027868617 /DNA_START=32 /DNA_END=946 /DNA_ORIENTATION=+
MTKIEIVVSKAAYGDTKYPFRCPQSMGLVFYIKMLEKQQQGEEGHCTAFTKSIYPYHPVTGRLPTCRDTNTHEWIPACDVMSHLCGRSGEVRQRNLDAVFSENEQGQIEAFREFILTKMLPVFYYCQWGDRTNHLRTERVWASSAPLFLRLTGYLSWKERARVMAVLSDANCTTKKGALKRAKICLSTLLKRFQTALGNTIAQNVEKEGKGEKGHHPSSRFLFGKASSADAVLSGLLYAVFESDISRNELRSLLRAEFPAFESYYRAMTTTFLDAEHTFPDFAALDAVKSKKGGLSSQLKGAEEW